LSPWPPLPLIVLCDRGPTSLLTGWASPIRTRVKGPMGRWAHWWRDQSNKEQPRRRREEQSGRRGHSQRASRWVELPPPALLLPPCSLSMLAVSRRFVVMSRRSGGVASILGPAKLRRQRSLSHDDDGEVCMVCWRRPNMLEQDIYCRRGKYRNACGDLHWVVGLSLSSIHHCAGRQHAVMHNAKDDLDEEGSEQ
jgi:hypothetical protein